jgi:signal transduction histidine kinase/CHASE3 domain sensor protein
MRGSLRRQALALLCAATALLVASGGATTYLTAQVDEASARATDSAGIQVALEDITVGMVDQETALRGYLLTRDPLYLEPFDRARVAVASHETEVEAELHDPATREAYYRMKSAAVAWQTLAGKQLVAFDADPAGFPVPASIADANGAFDRFRSERNGLEETAEQKLVTAQSDLRARASMLPWVLGGMSASVLLMVAVLGALIFQLILRPVRRLTTAAADLAVGKAAEITDLHRGDEVGQLARSLNEWREASLDTRRIVSAMAEMGGRVEMQEILDLGVQSLAEITHAEEVVVTMVDGDDFWSAASLTGTIQFSGNMTDNPTPELQEGSVTSVSIVDMTAGMPPEIREMASRFGPSLMMPMTAAGELLGFVAVSRLKGREDFTSAEGQHAEIMVPFIAAAIRVARTYDQLRDASMAKSRFLAVMSHELRTPLNSILGFSQVLAAEEFGPLNQRQSRYVGNVEKSGRRLLDLINDVLDLSKVEAGKLEFDIEDFPVDSVIAECVAEVGPLTAAKSLVVTSAPGIDLVARADRRRLRQVVLNLLSNAIKFTPDGGQLAVAAARQDGSVAIIVTDTGVGIPAAIQGRIFEEFIQADSGLVREQEGTGLGLALSRRLAEEMGGSLTVSSAEGAGSAFTVTVPSAVIDETGSSGPLVVVVDDDRDNRELLVTIVEEVGGHAVTAATAVEGLNAVRRHHPAAVLLDILFDGPEGWDVLETLKRDPATRGIPVIAVTVLDRVPARYRDMLDGYFSKAIERAPLIARLRELIEPPAVAEAV